LAVLLKLSKWLLVMALSISIGAPWAILQTVAWCGMAVSYSQGTTIKDGLAKTFDGRHPCKMCQLVAEGKKSEKKQETQLKISKIDLVAAAEVKPLALPPLQPGFFPACSDFTDRIESPLTPPPKNV
jgi:hypothetical protein